MAHFHPLDSWLLLIRFEAIIQPFCIMANAMLILGKNRSEKIVQPPKLINYKGLR